MAKWCHLVHNRNKIPIRELLDFLVKNGYRITLDSSFKSIIEILLRSRLTFNTLKSLYREDMDVNKQIKNGNTILSYCCCGGKMFRNEEENKVKVINFILDKGGDPTIKNKKGLSPFDQLCLSNNPYFQCNLNILSVIIRNMMTFCGLSGEHIMQRVNELRIHDDRKQRIEECIKNVGEEVFNSGYKKPKSARK